MVKYHMNSELTLSTVKYESSPCHEAGRIDSLIDKPRNELEGSVYSLAKGIKDILTTF